MAISLFAFTLPHRYHASELDVKPGEEEEAFILFLLNELIVIQFTSDEFCGMFLEPFQHASFHNLNHNR